MKRVFDIVLSFISIIFLLIPLIIIIILIRLTSKGNALFWSKRVGRDGITFLMPKFRSMRLETPDIASHLISDPEQYFTPIGKFLRKYSLDESIQFVSVLKGDMSLVGPRPAGPIELANYKEWQKRRLSVMPGLTGPWQVSGRNKINHFDDWVRLDLEYIDNWSLWLDIKILFKTIPAAFRGTGM